MSTPVREACAVEHIAERAAAYAMPGVQADGMDVLAVDAAMRPAVERARAGRGPTLIECKTYRFLGHSKSDQRVYRSRDEEAAWRARDPIARLRDAARVHPGLTSAALDAIASEAMVAVEAAVAFARQSPFPAAAALTDGVFSDATATTSLRCAS